jgi:exosortase/archaeosortase family protein
VPTDTLRRRPDALAFALRGVLWSLGLFGLLRLNWTETHILLPLTRLQAAGAAGLVDVPALPVAVTLACSGADALALCLAAVLAYPVTWRTRLAGAGGGAVLILGLNMLRIGTLGAAAASPVWFYALHVYIWPAVLTLGIAGYVFAWMRLADRPRTLDDEKVARPSRRFVGFTAAFLLVFTAASPIFFQSAGILALAGFVARSAAAILGIAGVSAQAAANVLWTPRGGFLVTQECISTPLIPVYLAAICSYVRGWRWRLLGVVATLPLFVALGIARLLVVALPDAVVASPIFFVHAFYQLLLGAVVVFIAALWRYGGRAALGHAMLGVVVGVLFVRVLGPFYTRAVTYGVGEPLEDPQNAIAFLPAFQVGLYLALWAAAFVGVGWKRFVAGLAVLGLSQTTGLLALHALATYAGFSAHVRDVRGWAVAGPLLIVATVANVARPRR